MRYTQPKLLYVEPYGKWLHIQWNDLYLTECKKRNIDISASNPGKTGGRFSTFEFEDGMVLFYMFLPRKYDEEVLWHECLHGTQRILEYYGIDSGPGNTDVVAHMQGYLTREVKRKLYKRKVT